MILLYYVSLLLPFALLFAMGYFPLRFLGHLGASRQNLGWSDVLAPLAGAVGTAVGFLLAGLSGYDRFALAADGARDFWMRSGLAFPLELAQALFSGGLCAILLALVARCRSRETERWSRGVPWAAFVISVVDFNLWPVLLSPLVS